MFYRSASYAAAALAAGLAILAPGSADAHRRWMMPSATVLSGAQETVSVDAAISNTLFGFDHHAMPIDDLVVTGPDGQAVEPKVIGSGAYRTVFDVPLARQGTYRIASVSDGMMGSYELNGERRRWRGSKAAMATGIPAGATDVRVNENSARTETFVTLGAPDTAALAPVGQGIEMVPVTHPNDLVAGEPARMRFLIDGQPAAGLTVEFVAGGTRYRDDAGSRMLTTDADGLVTLAAAEPGMYYLEASNGDDAGEGREPGRPNPGPAPRGDGGRAGKRMSYTAVLEFLPL